ncbi:predicted protein [Histoplasma capsulatum var. duboisii H88]|uniref:Predicted protein n=1 Tax=Ajellomyces capsulatus (strain H88) TaxID=544711 RepID=F0UM79_AJEC8|nr:predicted protein [Histoplasma capsulatum var. duboisii H88]
MAGIWKKKKKTTRREESPALRFFKFPKLEQSSQDIRGCWWDLLGRLFVLFTSDPGDGGRQGSLSPFPHIHYTLLMKCASGNEHWGLASVVIALIFTPDADKTRQCMTPDISSWFHPSPGPRGEGFPLFFHRHLPNPGEDDDDDYEDEINSLLHPHGRRRFENAVKATKVSSILERQTRPRAARSQYHCHSGDECGENGDDREIREYRKWVVPENALILLLPFYLSSYPLTALANGKSYSPIQEKNQGSSFEFVCKANPKDDDHDSCRISEFPTTVAAMHLSTATAEEPEGCDVCGAATGAGQKKEPNTKSFNTRKKTTAQLSRLAGDLTPPPDVCPKIIHTKTAHCWGLQSVDCDQTNTQTTQTDSTEAPKKDTGDGSCVPKSHTRVTLVPISSVPEYKNIRARHTLNCRSRRQEEQPLRCDAASQGVFLSTPFFTSAKIAFIKEKESTKGHMYLPVFDNDEAAYPILMFERAREAEVVKQYQAFFSPKNMVRENGSV